MWPFNLVHALLISILKPEVFFSRLTLFPLSLFEASDYGMRLPILRSSPEDQVLYQTERYNEDTFGYDIPIREEGDYILVMKYAEVYFAQSQQKVKNGETGFVPYHWNGMNRSERASETLLGSCGCTSLSGF